jgi:hypothetical protein
MPSLPVYNSSQNINTQPAGVERHQAAQPFEDIQKMTSAVSDNVQRLSQVNDVMQETKAKTQAEVALAQQEQLAQNDPDPNNAEMHIKAINDLTKNATKGIDNQEVAGKVGLEIQQSAFLSQIKIQDLFKHKQMFANDQSLDQLATTTAANKANAVSVASGQQDEDNFMHTISKNVNTGLITPERGMQLVKQYKVGVAKNKILQSNSTNQSDYKGVMDGLDLQESTNAQKMIDAHIKQIQQTDIKNTLNNRITTIKGIANGQFDWKNSDLISKVATKDSDLGEALQSVFNSEASGQKYQPENDQDQNFADLVNRIYSQGTKQDISDFTVSVLKSHGNREISKDRLAILINAAEERSSGLPTNKESGDSNITPQHTILESTVKGIKDLFSGAKDAGQKAGNVLNNFFKNIASGSGPQQAQQEAMKTFNVKEYPWISSLPKEGAVKVDKNGNKVRIYPDGHYEDVK